MTQLKKRPILEEVEIILKKLTFSVFSSAENKILKCAIGARYICFFKLLQDCYKDVFHHLSISQAV